jgi:hypothetical protein
VRAHTPLTSPAPSPVTHSLSTTPVIEQGGTSDKCPSLRRVSHACSHGRFRHVWRCRCQPSAARHHPRAVPSYAGGLERAGGRAAVTAAVAAGQRGRPRLAGARSGPGLRGRRLERGGLAAGRRRRRLQAREARLARLQDAVRDPAHVSGRASSPFTPLHALVICPSTACGCHRDLAIRTMIPLLIYPPGQGAPVQMPAQAATPAACPGGAHGSPWGAEQMRPAPCPVPRNRRGAAGGSTDTHAPRPGQPAQQQEWQARQSRDSTAQACMGARQRLDRMARACMGPHQTLTRPDLGVRGRAPVVEEDDAGLRLGRPGHAGAREAQALEHLQGIPGFG